MRANSTLAKAVRTEVDGRSRNVEPECMNRSVTAIAPQQVQSGMACGFVFTGDLLLASG